jgi:cytochrome bd-type quinol oxidase subunit 2
MIEEVYRRREEKTVRRKVFDMLASTGGVIVVIVLAVAGALLFVGYNFANNYVHTQLAEQQITFPPAAAFAHPKAGTEITPSMIPSVSQYAGQQLTTGPQAEAYANDFIAVHLQEIGGGKTYAQLSADAMALPKGSPAYTAAEAKVQSVFQGTTLRGMLLEAYGFSLIATIAFWCAIAAWALAAVMAVLVLLGFVHAARTNDSEELMTHHVPKGVVVSA